MSENVGRIYYDVDANTSGLLKAERDVDSSTRNMEDGFKKTTRATDEQGRSLNKLKPITAGVRQETQRLQGTLQGVQKMATLAAAALAAVGVVTGVSNAINDIANFQQSVLQLGVVSGATKSQMAALEVQARELGATSMFSAKQAADAQVFLAQAGFDANEILAATPGILELAAAGSMDLARAADIASNVLGGMRLEVDQLGRVNDVLAATAAGSNTNIEQMGQALSFAAPIAASAGVEIEDLSAAIGVLGDSGLQASRAGTGIVGVIRQLSNVSKDGRSALAAYGLSVEDVDIKANGLTNVLETLRRANIGVEDSFRIFGSEAGTAAQILANGAERVSQFGTELRDVEGTAKAAALALGSGLLGSMRSLQSALSETVLQLGDSGLASALQDVINTATGVISILNGMGEQFKDVNDVSDEAYQKLERLVSMVRLLGDAVVVLSGALAGRLVAGLWASVAAASAGAGAFGVMTAAVTALRTALMAVFGPVGLIAGALTLIFQFRRELGLVQQPIEQTRLDINGLANAFRTLEEAQRLLTSSALAGNLAVQRAAAAKLKGEIEEVTQLIENSGQLTPQGGAMEIATADDLARGRELQRQLAGINTEIADGEQLLEEYNQIMAELSHTSSEVEPPPREIVEVLGDAAREAKRLDDQYKNLIDRLYPFEASARKYREEMELLELKAKTDDTIDLADAQERLRLSMMNTGKVWEEYDLFSGKVDKKDEKGTYWEEWLKSAEKALTDVDALAANVADRFQSDFGSAFESMIFDSESFKDAFQGMAESMIRNIVRSVGEMGAQWVAYQAIQLALGKSSEAAAVAGAAATGTAIASAYAPAAAAVSLATFGANAAAANLAMAGTYAAAKGMALTGMAHDGIDNIPKEGTWLLQQGERVVGADLNRDLTRYLQNGQSNGQGGARVQMNIQLIESRERAGEVNQRTDPNGEESAEIFVADIYGDGPRSQAIREKFNLQPRGT